MLALYLSKKTLFGFLRFSAYVGPGPEECGPAPAHPDHLALHADLPVRRGGKRGRLSRYHQEQVHAHRHQLLPLLPRSLRPHDTRAR